MQVHATDHRDDWTLLFAADRDMNALAELFHRHRDYVFRLAMGLCSHKDAAEDITQDVFIKLQRCARPRQIRARFRTWLYRVAVNQAREHLRRQQRHRVLDYQAESPASGHPPDRGANLADLARALSKLPRRQREVVVLRYLEGLSTAETAAVIGCTTGTIKVHLHRAVAALKSQYLASDAMFKPA